MLHEEEKFSSSYGFFSFYYTLMVSHVRQAIKRQRALLKVIYTSVLQFGSTFPFSFYSHQQASLHGKCI